MIKPIRFGVVASGVEVHDLATTAKQAEGMGFRALRSTIISTRPRGDQQSDETFQRLSAIALSLCGACVYLSHADCKVLESVRR